MNKRTSSVIDQLGRQSEPAVLILTSLASGSKHGYALAKDITSFAGVNLGPGTLYGAITRLEERGLIAPAPSEERRQPYVITTSGRAALESAVREMRALADEGARRLRLRTHNQQLHPRPIVTGVAP
ncbi:MAG TPA: PadR family transcriptional regulator [Acidimicrobiales bacterium]|nr:PadR family transcriptional regulator [Acidimicrobiales bacterium]